jgi:hypothetical protein
MIWVITVQRPGDAKATDWFFDVQAQYNDVISMLKTLGVKHQTREDYITDSGEFRRWWKREG